MDGKQCAELIDLIANGLEAYAEYGVSNWDQKKRRWLTPDGTIANLADTLKECYEECRCREIARWIEINLDSGPSRRRRFCDILGQLFGEAQQVEGLNGYAPYSDPFRWARESVHEAAAELCHEMEQTAEYMRMLADKIRGKKASKKTTEPKAGSKSAKVIELAKQGLSREVIAERADLDVDAVSSLKSRFKNIIDGA